MGGPSSPSVFHTTPPQPALKARTTLYSLSVGGAEASQNGFGDLMPTKLVRRSAMSVLPSSLFRAAQSAVDGVGGDLAVLDALHGQVGAAGDAVTAGPDVGERGLHLLVHRDLAVGEVERFLRLAVDRVFHELLPDRLEHLVAQDREGLAGANEAAAIVERRA